jgi:acyl-CoA dehydrogenase
VSEHEVIRTGVRELCRRFPDAYWRELDQEHRYPEEFVRAMTEAGWLAVLIPEEYGGAGLGVTEAALVLEEINRSGGSGLACHAQMYTMGALQRHGSEEQKRRWLPEIAAGRLRLQSVAVTEPDAGSDTTRISTFAERVGDRYRVRGRKVFISRIQHSDLLMLLCRTTRADEVERRTEGLSLLLVDLREAGERLEVRPIRTMVNHETNELVFDGLEVPVENLIGEEGRGFRCILSGLNAERILVASEAVGDGLFFVDRSSRYAGERIVFGRPIGQNQAVVDNEAEDVRPRVVAHGIELAPPAARGRDVEFRIEDPGLADERAGEQHAVGAHSARPVSFCTVADNLPPQLEPSGTTQS